MNPDFFKLDAEWFDFFTERRDAPQHVLDAFYRLGGGRVRVVLDMAHKQNYFEEILEYLTLDGFFPTHDLGVCQKCWGEQGILFFDQQVPDTLSLRIKQRLGEMETGSGVPWITALYPFVFYTTNWTLETPIHW